MIHPGEIVGYLPVMRMAARVIGVMHSKNRKLDRLTGEGSCFGQVGRRNGRSWSFASEEGQKSSNDASHWYSVIVANTTGLAGEEVVSKRETQECITLATHDDNVLDQAEGGKGNSKLADGLPVR